LELIDIISDIYRKICHAAMRADRDPEHVRLIAVSKMVEVRLIKEAVDAGLRLFGESRVQEARDKAGELRDMGIVWHMVGHLQRNKVKQAVELFDFIHSVDSIELSKAINRHAADMPKVQKVMVQVNLTGEKTKFGVDESSLKDLISAVREMNNLSLEGLMTIAPFFDTPEKARPVYKRLRTLADEYGLRELSMGMSSDFETAVEEGATLVRVGTAIFGRRKYA
jgi:pyridoxal phosphate enzyme (YggS family)